MKKPTVGITTAPNSENQPMMRALLAAKPRLNLRAHGETPIFYAARLQRLKTLDLLIAAGADPSIKDDRGRAKAPLLLWGPYFWADGTTPRKSDGLVWERNDMAADGVHPTESGRRKVANQLLAFFKTDELAKTWFAKSRVDK